MIVQCAAIGFVYVKGAIYASDLQSLVTQLLTIYSIPFGVIVGGVFGRDYKERSRVVGTPFWAAMAMASMWNLLLAFRTATFVVAEEDSMRSLSNYFDAVSAAGLFLVSGSLAYFFAKRDQN